MSPGQAEVRRKAGRDELSLGCLGPLLPRGRSEERSRWLSGYFQLLQDFVRQHCGVIVHDVRPYEAVAPARRRCQTNTGMPSSNSTRP